MRVAVISLKRTPERWHAFLQRNHQALKQCELLRIDGIDGSELLHSNIKTRLIALRRIKVGVQELLGLA